MQAEDHSPDDVLTALRLGVDYSFTVKVRGLELRMRPLSISEQVGVTNDAAEEMSVKPKSAQNAMTEASLLAIRTLELASSEGPNSKVLGRLQAHVLQRMTNDELMALYRAYSDGCDKLNPAMETISPDQLDELADAAKKNPSGLKDLPQPRLVQLVRFLLTLGE